MHRQGKVTVQDQIDCQDFLSFLNEQGSGDSWCFNELTIVNLEGLVTSIIQGAAVIVSNGSFQDSYATAAIIIEGSSSSSRMTTKVSLGYVRLSGRGYGDIYKLILFNYSTMPF